MGLKATIFLSLLCVIQACVRCYPNTCHITGQYRHFRCPPTHPFVPSYNFRGLCYNRCVGEEEDLSLVEHVNANEEENTVAEGEAQQPVTRTDMAVFAVCLVAAQAVTLGFVLR